MQVDRELLEIFLEEARGYLAKLRDPALSASQRADAAHGLKGASSMLGFELLRALGVELERRIREREVLEEARLLHEVERELQALGGSTPDGGAAPPGGGDPPGDAGAGGGAAPPGGVAPAAAGAPPAAAAPPTGPPPAAADAALDAEWSPDEARMLRAFFVDEAREHLDHVVQALLDLGRDRTRHDVLNLLFRETHTLKGSAATVGLRAIAERSHRLEDRFVRLRDGHEQLDEDGVDRFLAEADLLREMVEHVAEAGTGAAPPPAAPAPPPPAAPAAPAFPRDAARVQPDDDLARIAKTPAEEPGLDDLDRRGADRRFVGRRRDERQVLRVDASRLDQMMDAVGELVFERTRIERRAQEFQGVMRDLAESRATLRALLSHRGTEETLAAVTTRVAEVEGELASAGSSLELTTAGLLDDTAALRRSAALLQDGLTRLRMMPLHWLYARLERPTRDAARADGKQVTLVTRGEETELDKMVVEQITDPLIQLVRNAIAHGVEPPAERRAAGKPETGTITVAARHQGDFVYIEVEDDGRGIDFPGIRAHLRASGREADAAELPEDALVELLFSPGFSTRQQADELAGRGVGLDVVRDNIARLGGDLAVSSRPGQGSHFVVRLPLTTAITTAVLFKVGGQVYGLPAAYVLESGYCDPQAAAPDGGAGAQAGAAAQGSPLLGSLQARGGDVPVLSLHRLLGAEIAPGQRRVPAIVLSFGDRHFAVSCDKIVGPREIVVRSLGPLLAPLPLYAGATISGAGKVQLVLDLASLAALVTGAPALQPVPAPQAARVLLCDDSRSLREAVSRILAVAGYAVQTAPDGWEAWELLQDHPFDLLVTDLEMPRMDGFDLIARVRRDPELKALPILVLTSRSSVENRMRCDTLGATGLLSKPVNRRVFIERVGDVLRLPKRS
jgi:chemosensory pili system protein ChpA (sensor histidine kinase/response regulator)